MRRNPKLMKGPDLFGGDSAVFVPLEDLSEAELKKLTYNQFTPGEWKQLSKDVQEAVMENSRLMVMNLSFEELLEDWYDVPIGLRADYVKEKVRVSKIDDDDWDELDEDVREFILDWDPESEERIEKFADLFAEAYKNEMEPSDDYVLEMVGTDGFDNFLAENRDHMIERAEQEGHGGEIETLQDELMEEFELSEESAHEVIEEAMQDEDCYEREVSDEYSSAFFKDCSSTSSCYVDGVIIADLIEGLKDEEIQRAIDETNSRADDLLVTYDYSSRRSRSMTPSDIRNLAHRNRCFERELDHTVCVDWEPDWETIGRKARELAEDHEPDGDELPPSEERKRRWALPPEERVVYRFPDGFYVLELTPDEMPAEGARNDAGLHHCIGQEEYGYPRAVRTGRGRAFSLRTPSGRRKLAFFADLNRAGEIVEFSEAKGKSNRLPGWDLRKAGQEDQKLKQDEVAKALEFIAKMGVDPNEVTDLRPALMRIWSLADKRDPWAHEIIGRIQKILPSFQDPRDHQKRKLRGNPPVRETHRSCPDCGGAATGFCRPYRPKW